MVPWWWPIKVETCRQTVYNKNNCAFVGVTINIVTTEVWNESFRKQGQIRMLNNIKIYMEGLVQVSLMWLRYGRLLNLLAL
jgi:hypothetical protein